MTGCTVSQNSAGGEGGSISMQAGTMTIRACTLSGNIACNYSGGA